MIDIHNHLAPGVDDGSRSSDESTRHIRTMAAEGVTRLAVTPHLNGTLVHDPRAFGERLEQLQGAYDALAAALRGRDDLLPVAFAQEIYLPDVASASAKALWADARVGYPGTRYCLIEFGFQLPAETEPIVRAVVEAGRRPVVAHPERYLRSGAPVALEEVASWRRAGAILQVNAGSLVGRYGDEIAELAWRILSLGLASLVATDNHADTRPYSLQEAATALRARGASEQAELLLRVNPARILDDEDTLAVPGLPAHWREGSEAVA